MPERRLIFRAKWLKYDPSEKISEAFQAFSVGYSFNEVTHTKLEDEQCLSAWILCVALAERIVN
jgi:hypothetical protein